MEIACTWIVLAVVLRSAVEGTNGESDAVTTPSFLRDGKAARVNDRLPASIPVKVKAEVYTKRAATTVPSSDGVIRVSVPGRKATTVKRKPTLPISIPRALLTTKYAKIKESLPVSHPLPTSYPKTRKTTSTQTTLKSTTYSTPTTASRVSSPPTTNPRYSTLPTIPTLPPRPSHMSVWLTVLVVFVVFVVLAIVYFLVLCFRFKKGVFHVYREQHRAKTYARMAEEIRDISVIDLPSEMSYGTVVGSQERNKYK